MAEINLFALATDLGTALGIDAFSGGLILTLILVMSIIIFPLYKGRYNIVMGLFVMTISLCVGLTWLNVYIFIIILAATAAGLAYKFKDLFG